jgi:hypothetical protein
MRAIWALLRVERQTVPEVSIDHERTAIDDTALQTLNLGSGGHFDGEHFAFDSWLAANRDHLPCFDLLHDHVMLQSQPALDRGDNRDALMTSTTGHEHLDLRIRRTTTHQ